MQNLAQLSGGALLLTLSLLTGCSPDGDALADASGGGPGTGAAAASPGLAGGTQNSGGGDLRYLSLVAGAPDRVAFRGKRRLELYYEPPGIIYREDIGTDGSGNFSIELIEVLTPIANPELFQILQDGREVMTYRFRDWMIRDYALFEVNYTYTELNPATVVAGRSCAQVEVMSKAPGTQIRYVVDVDTTNGIVMRWEEQDLFGQVLARMEYETYEPQGDVRDMTLIRRKYPTSTHALDEDLDAIFGFVPLIPTLLPSGGFQLLPELEKSIAQATAGGPAGEWAKVFVTDGLEIAVMMSRAPDLNDGNGDGRLGIVNHMRLGSWSVLDGDVHGFRVIVAGKVHEDDLKLMLQSAVDGR